MFYGEFKYLLDVKGRIQIPAPIREPLRQSGFEWLMVTRGLDGCLFGYSEEGWKEVVTRFANAKAFTSAKLRDFNRLFFSKAAKCTLDRQGRITLPAPLREFASLGREVVVVGVNTRVEFWNNEKWEARTEAIQPEYEPSAEELML